MPPSMAKLKLLRPGIEHHASAGLKRAEGMGARGQSNPNQEGHNPILLGHVEIQIYCIQLDLGYLFKEGDKW